MFILQIYHCNHKIKKEKQKDIKQKFQFFFRWKKKKRGSYLKKKQRGSYAKWHVSQ